VGILRATQGIIMRGRCAPKIPHGFSIATIAIVILLLWGLRWGSIVVPQIRSTADRVASLNNLQNVDLKLGGCVPIKGNL